MSCDRCNHKRDNCIYASGGKGVVGETFYSLERLYLSKQYAPEQRGGRPKPPCLAILKRSSTHSRHRPAGGPSESPSISRGLNPLRIELFAPCPAYLLTTFLMATTTAMAMATAVATITATATLSLRLLGISRASSSQSNGREEASIAC